MRYENIIDVLLSRFPEISRRYNEEKDYVEGLPHLVFEIVFVPYFREVIQSGDQNTKLQVVELLEEMISCADEKVQEIVVVSVLEPLLSERDFLQIIRNQLGLKTQESLRVLEKDFGWA